MPILALLPSPLLGPAVWEPVVPALTRRGWDVAAIPGLPRAPTCVDDAVVAYRGVLPVDRDIVLVPHSNAGVLAPLIAVGRPVAGYVFVDARLPPDSGTVPVADPRQLAFLAEKADADGLLPPWTAWWDPPDRDELFPDDAAVARVEREQHRLPLSYFADRVPIPAGWDDRPSGYLSFGDTYARELADAADRGWAVRRLPGKHLHMLVEPDTVAAAIDDLLIRIGIVPAGD
jgi:hypothetical protein